VSIPSNLDKILSDAIAADVAIVTLREQYTTGNGWQVADALITYIQNST
jgi:hypothetical protein